MKKYGLHDTGKRIDRINPEKVKEKGWQWFDSREERNAAIPDLSYEEKLQVTRHVRRQAYQQESDPLFFEWHRGNATEQDWLDKIEDIKQRFPKPSESSRTKKQ